MKISKIILPVLLAVVIAGCGKSSPDADSSTSQQLDQLKADTKQAATDMKNYTYAEKDKFVAAMQAELDALNQEFAALSAKIANASDAVKADAQPKLDALKAQIAKLGPELDKAKNATESTWDQVKAGAVQAYDDTKQAFKDAAAWVDKKVNG